MQDLITFLSQHSSLSIAMASVIVLLLIIETMRAQRSTFAVSPVRATQLINRENAAVFDIRSEELYKAGHIIDAQRWQMADLKNTNKKLEKYKSKPIILVCGSGLESQKAATALNKDGYHAYVLSKGMRAWTDASMPIVKG